MAVEQPFLRESYITHFLRLSMLFTQLLQCRPGPYCGFGELHCIRRGNTPVHMVHQRHDCQPEPQDHPLDHHHVPRPHVSAFVPLFTSLPCLDACGCEHCLYIEGSSSNVTQDSSCSVCLYRYHTVSVHYKENECFRQMCAQFSVQIPNPLICRQNILLHHVDQKVGGYRLGFLH